MARRLIGTAFTALALLAPVPAAAGLFGGALGAYEEHEFDKAIEKCKGERDLECKLVVAFSYLEKYELYKNKGDKEQAKAHLSILAVDVGPKDVRTIEKFLTAVGRRKFLSPIYRALAATPEGLERARKIYAVARPGYHSVSQGSIDGILKWEAKASAS